MSGVLHALLDFESPGAAGLAIRRLATVGPTAVVVTAKTFSYLKRDCDSEKQALKWLANVATETGKPIALNLGDGPDTSITTFISPKDWSQVRLQGWIGARHQELEAIFGPVITFGQDIPPTPPGQGTPEATK